MNFDKSRLMISEFLYYFVILNSNTILSDYDELNKIILMLYCINAHDGRVLEYLSLKHNILGDQLFQAST